MMTQVPKLRFQEFNEPWKKRKVGEIFTVTRGQVLSMNLLSSEKSNTTPYPVYSSQTKNDGLAGFYQRKLYEDAVTWTTDGANAGDVKFRRGPFFCTNVCGVLLSKKGEANTFTAAAIQNVSKKHVSYVGNPKLMNGVMASIEIFTPDIAEQKKIADTLSAVDDKTSSLREHEAALIRFKAGLMQKLFSQELRFQQDDGKEFPDWETFTLNDIATIKQGTYLAKNAYENGPFSVQGAGSEMGTHVQANFPHALTVVGKVGTVGKPRFFANGCWVNNNASAIFPKHISVVPFFLHILLVQIDWKTVSAQTAQPFLITEDLLSCEFAVPCIEEQKKIANTLSTMDAKINAVGKESALMEVFKKGLLQQMFV